MNSTDEPYNPMLLEGEQPDPKGKPTLLMKIATWILLLAAVGTLFYIFNKTQREKELLKKVSSEVYFILTKQIFSSDCCKCEKGCYLCSSSKIHRTFQKYELKAKMLLTAPSISQYESPNRLIPIRVLCFFGTFQKWNKQK